MFQEKLKEISAQVQQVILEDDFSGSVSPFLLREAVLAYPRRKGKSLRPALLLWSCGLYDPDFGKALKIAAALELYHIWTLVHDDIIDNDDLRRGNPSVHALVKEKSMKNYKGITSREAAEYGKTLAILCGDIQHAWSNYLILQGVQDGVSPEVVLSIIRRLNGYVNPALISGEAIDVEFTLRPIREITPEEMRAMLIQKTGKLFRFAAETGAQIGLSTSHTHQTEVKRLGDFAEKAALAFQLKDDLLGVFADEKKLGKPVGSDIREGKRTLITSVAVAALKGADLNFFLSLLENKSCDNTDLIRVQNLLRSCGAVDKLELEIKTLLQEAEEDLTQFPDNSYRGLLGDWLAFIGERKY